MNHQRQTHHMSEPQLTTLLTEQQPMDVRSPNLPSPSRRSSPPLLGGLRLACTVAIATLLGALSSSLSAAEAKPISDLSPYSSAADLSETVLVPEMQDSDLPVALPQTLSQTFPESTTSESADDEYRFGHRGDDRWYINVGAATTLDNDEARRLVLAGAGLSHFFLNGHSINLELNGLAFDQTGDDAVGLNLNAMLRWHLHRADNWSVYVDGGAGLLGTTNEVPAAGSQLNFTPQVGAGATIRLKDEERLMVGLRWHHISNADLYPPNPGRDSLYGYVGWNLPR